MPNQIGKYWRWDILLLLIGVLIVFSSYSELMHSAQEQSDVMDVSEGWSLYVDENTNKRVNIASRMDYDDQRMIVLEKPLTAEMLKRGQLIFRGHDMGVLAYYGNYVVYSFGVENRFSGTKRFYGDKWHVIHLPAKAEEGEAIRLFLLPNEPVGAMKLLHVYAADPYDFSNLLLKKNQFSLLCSVVAFIFSMIAIGYYFVNYRRVKSTGRIIYIGLFAFFSFASLFLKNPWLQFLYFDAQMMKIISFVASCLMFIPVFMVIADTPDFDYKNRVYFLASMTSVYTLAKLGLYMAAELDVYMFDRYEKIAKLGVGLYYVGLLYRDYWKTRNEAVGHLLLPSTIFLLSIVVDSMLSWWMPDRVSSNFLAFGTMVTLLLLTFQAAKEIRAAQNRSLWTEHYKSIAGLDIMTGLENQDAFIEVISGLEELDQLGAIAMDVNNLKATNDRFGHPAGDELIVALAKLVNESFGDDFRKFRLGGDEFVILSDGRDEESLRELVWRLNGRIKRYNEEQSNPLHVAVGVAVYDRSLDSDVHEMLARADRDMYLKKISMKR